MGEKLIVKEEMATRAGTDWVPKGDWIKEESWHFLPGAWSLPEQGHLWPEDCKLQIFLDLVSQDSFWEETPADELPARDIALQACPLLSQISSLGLGVSVVGTSSCVGQAENWALQAVPEKARWGGRPPPPQSPVLEGWSCGDGAREDLTGLARKGNFCCCSCMCFNFLSLFIEKKGGGECNMY